jgi:hypothetical protein
VIIGLRFLSAPIARGVATPAFRQQTDYRGTHRWTAFPKDLRLSRPRTGATFTARFATVRWNPSKGAVAVVDLVDTQAQKKRPRRGEQPEPSWDVPAGFWHASISQQDKKRSGWRACGGAIKNRRTRVGSRADVARFLWAHADGTSATIRGDANVRLIVFTSLARTAILLERSCSIAPATRPRLNRPSSSSTAMT